jgi:hypothetical protein
MCQDEIVLNPGNKMIFEGAFDDLMEEVGREQFMNICTWKVIGERL